MKQFGLIGRTLSHSFSQSYFTEKFARLGLMDYQYDLFELPEITDLPELLQSHPRLRGLNVTIPYKVAVLPFLNSIHEDAALAGAVNCIAINRSHGQPVLHGYNTDSYGFETSLKPLLKPHHQQALILGSGGASRAVQVVLNKLAIPFRIVSRTGTLTYDTLTGLDIRDHTLIINTTPLGMYPRTDNCPDIPYDSMSSKHLAYDLVYNPSETLFMKHAATYGAVVKNGLEMLHLQAERSWEIFNL